jgi:hypothetical protein
MDHYVANATQPMAGGRRRTSVQVRATRRDQRTTTNNLARAMDAR